MAADASAVDAALGASVGRVGVKMPAREEGRASQGVGLRIPVLDWGVEEAVDLGLLNFVFYLDFLEKKDLAS